MATTLKSKVSFSIVKPFILPVGILVLILISARVIIWPRIDKISKLSRSIMKEETRLSQLTEKLTLLKSLNEPELASRSKLVTDALPESKRPIYIMSVLKQVSKESGVQTQKMSVKPGLMATESAKKKAQVPSLTFPMVVLGTYDDAIRFVKRLAKTVPMVRVERLSFRRAGGKDLWEVSSEVASFYLSLPKTLGKIDSPVRVVTEKENKICDQLKQFSSPYAASGILLPPVESGRDNPFI